jgi:hypothetical protein
MVAHWFSPQQHWLCPCSLLPPAQPTVAETKILQTWKMKSIEAAMPDQKIEFCACRSQAIGPEIRIGDTVYAVCPDCGKPVLGSGRLVRLVESAASDSTLSGDPLMSLSS